MLVQKIAYYNRKKDENLRITNNVKVIL